MTIKEAIIQQLLRTAQITQVVGKRIRPNHSVQGETVPRLVVEVLGAEPQFDTTGSSELQMSEVLITAYGQDEKQAADLGELVRKTLHGMPRGNIDNAGELQSKGCFCRDIRDAYLPPQDGGQVGQPAVQLDFDLWHSVA